PKNAATTDTFGPKPSFSTTYGYDAPMIAATMTPVITARIENSRASAGLGMTPGRLSCGSDPVLIGRDPTSVWSLLQPRARMKQPRDRIACLLDRLSPDRVQDATLCVEEQRFVLADGPAREGRCPQWRERG